MLALALMVAFGFGVHWYVGTLKSTAARAGERPKTSQVNLPGTLYVSQAGGLFKLRGGNFTQIEADAPNGGWMQPAPTPDGRLVVVKRDFNSSDLWVIDGDGKQLKQLTHNRAAAVEDNQWSFYPSVSVDGKQVFMSYDKALARTDFTNLSVYAFPLTGTAPGTRWSTPQDGSGGDTRPRSLRTGGLLYAGYGLDDKNARYAQIWAAAKPLAKGKPLTAAADNCSQPALSPDQTRLAMICTDKQVSRLEVASFDVGTLTMGPRQVVVDGQMATGPVWAPDGGGVAYLAPADATGHFQLWWLPLRGGESAPSSQSTGGTTPAAASGPPPKPVQVTVGYDLEATSAPAWT